MGCRVTELQCKEVVCVSDGCRLGFVADVVVDIMDGKVKALVVPDKAKMGGLMNGREEFIIPWEAIRRIGDDIILVDCALNECRRPRQKGKWFS